MGAEVISLGCRLNLSESEELRGLLAKENDLVVVNSCAVTAEAVRQSRRAVRRLRAANPDARLLVTGCAATIDPDAFAAMPEVDGVVANAAVPLRISSIALVGKPCNYKVDIKAFGAL